MTSSADDVVVVGDSGGYALALAQSMKLTDIVQQIQDYIVLRYDDASPVGATVVKTLRVCCLFC